MRYLYLICLIPVTLAACSRIQTSVPIPTIPRYPESQWVSSSRQSLDGEEGQQTTTKYVTQASPDRVREFYLTELSKQDWVVISDKPVLQFRKQLTSDPSQCFNYELKLDLEIEGNKQTWIEETVISRGCE